MNILALNCGSSSVKIDLIRPHDGDSKRGTSILQMALSRLLSDEPSLQISGQAEQTLAPANFETLLNQALQLLTETVAPQPVEAVVHRVVHGGEQFHAPTIITEEVERAIAELSSLAPLHNPVNLAGIQAAKQMFASVPHIAVFDTAFHATLPKRAKTYALPTGLREHKALRRYGFHGTSHQYVAARAAEFLEADFRDLRLITCHLGNGCSVAAVEYGTSVETSMGFTPLEGLVMGTRCGDLDPGIVLELLRSGSWSIDELDTLLNKESGLKGLSGATNDMRDILAKAADGDDAAQLAVAVFSHRLRKYIGAYAAVMGGVDAIVLTGGIGENSAEIRHRATQRLGFLGAVLDEDRNRDLKLSADESVIDFAARTSRVRLLAIATNEQQAMAVQAAEVLETLRSREEKLEIPIGVSARHVHLTQEMVEQLFGKGHQLSEYKKLLQPGQFAANEVVTLVGPRNSIEGVRILGPTRSLNQIEISRTDEYFIGIDAPVRQSGNVENTPGITLVGPKGSAVLPCGVICAWRHIHMTPEDAQRLAVRNGDVVDVRVQQGERGLVFGNVLIRVSEKYVLEMHIDTDEANAAEIGTGAVGEILSP